MSTQPKLQMGRWRTAVSRVVALSLTSVLLLFGAAGCGAAGGRPKPVWPGGGAWTDLAKLGNYSFQSSYHLRTAPSTASLSVDGEYHDPSDYQLTGDMSGAAGGQQVALIDAGNHYYAGIPGGEFVDLRGNLRQSPGGSTGSNNATAKISQGLGAFNTAWSTLLAGSSGRYTGPCLIAGRPGNSFALNVSLYGLASWFGLGKIGGAACLDAATNAPLRLDVAWQQKGGSSSLNAHFLVTGVGNVPSIPAPAGAVPLSSLARQGGAGMPRP